MNLTPWKSNAAKTFNRSRIGDEITSLQREMNNLMENFFSRGEITMPQFSEAAFVPSINLQEKDDKYILEADVPGMKESDIDIDFKNNTLTIKGENKQEAETKEGDYLCVERSYGSFRRDVSFDADVDQNNIKADLKNGVLRVELAKKENSKAVHKKIPIRH